MAENLSSFGTNSTKKIPKKWSEEDLERIENCAKWGMVEKQIATIVGVTYASLQHYKKQNKDFMAAVARGRAEGQRIVGAALTRKCESGNPRAIALYFELTGRIQQIPDKNEKDLGIVVKSHDGSKEEHLTVSGKE